MKVLICGSRGITDESQVVRAMNLVPFTYTEVVHGGARGVDRIAGRLAKRSNLKVTEFLPDWDKFGRGAGFIRNKEMVDYADAVIAVWDGKSKGTKHTIDYARQQNKPLFIQRENNSHTRNAEA